MPDIREKLENRQVGIYFVAVAAGAVTAAALPGTAFLGAWINPALAFMLFVTFLQVPLGELRNAFSQWRFLGILLLTNFVAVPLLVAILIQIVPADPMMRLGVLLVLLAPCIDYVVTFSHLGRADARLLLAATPALLVIQMMLLPVYLGVLLDQAAGDLVQIEPFLHAFFWLIGMPLVLAVAMQLWAARSDSGAGIALRLGLLPVPATAAVLFIVAAAVVPQLGDALSAAVQVFPVYVAFAIAAPLLGWYLARLFRLDPPAARAVAFSAATRNSLVVLPLALAVPGAVPLLPAVIVTQTLVELISELGYVRFAPMFGSKSSRQVS